MPFGAAAFITYVGKNAGLAIANAASTLFGGQGTSLAMYPNASNITAVYTEGEILEYVRAAEPQLVPFALGIFDGEFGSLIAPEYPPGEGRLPGLMMAGDLKGVRTSAVKDRGGLLDGDYHRV